VDLSEDAYVGSAVRDATSETITLLDEQVDL